MTGGREVVLGRIREALGSSAAVPEVPREYRQAGAAGGDVTAIFCERAADYLATVRRVGESELEAAVAEVCAGRGSTRVIVAAEAASRMPSLAIVPDDPDIRPADLDGYDAALTGCALAIAETGTIVLDGGPASGRRALTLVPDHHICVVDHAQIVATVPEAIARLEEAAAAGRPITFVSGPSATSDIELERVEGVHGPRKLDILVVT